MPDVVVTAKRCPRCATTKPVAEFNRNRARPDGLDSMCRTCANAHQRDYAARHLEKVRARGAQWALENPERMAERQRRYRARHPDLVAQRNRIALLKYRVEKRAHKQVAHAVAIGRLIRPDRCVNCGRTAALHAHHDDYAQPLDVRWLCSRCHKVLHLEAA